jgi:hypothetical protein
VMASVHVEIIDSHLFDIVCRHPNTIGVPMSAGMHIITARRGTILIMFQHRRSVAGIHSLEISNSIYHVPHTLCRHG